MFDRLVGRAIFAQPDTVVRANVDHADLLDRGQADSVAHIIAEHQEGAAIGDDAAVQRHAVHRGSHTKFANAVMDIAASVISRREQRLALGLGVVGAGQIRRTAQQFRQCRHQCVERHFAGLAGRNLGRRRHQTGQIGRHRIGGGQLACHAPLELAGLAVGSETRSPICARRLAAGAKPFPPGLDVSRDLERAIFPAQRGAGAFDLLGAQWRAMAAAGAGLGRSPLADRRAGRNQAWPRIGLGRRQRRINAGEIMAIASHNMPAGGGEAPSHVFAGRQAHRAIDRNLVVVPDHVEAAQLQMARQRNRFLADAFHQAAIAGHNPGVVIDQRIAKHAVQVPLRHRHAHRHRQALPQRPGGAFHARQLGGFRMTGAWGMPLAEALDVIQGRLLIAGQVQQRIDQHRTMAGRQHKAVPIRPARRLGIELQVIGEQHGRDIGHAHRHSRVAAVGSFHRIHSQRPDGIGAACEIGHEAVPVNHPHWRCSRYGRERFPVVIVRCGRLWPTLRARVNLPVALHRDCRTQPA